MYFLVPRHFQPPNPSCPLCFNIPFPTPYTIPPLSILITVDIGRLPDFSPFFCWWALSHAPHPQHLRQTCAAHTASLCTQVGPSAPTVPLRLWSSLKPLPRLLHFASLAADLQLPQCFRQVSHRAFTVAVVHAELVQPDCYLNQLRISKITFSVAAVGLALCTTARNALLLFPEQLPFPLEYWQTVFLRKTIKSLAALTKCLSSSGMRSRT